MCKLGMLPTTTIWLNPQGEEEEKKKTPLWMYICVRACSNVGRRTCPKTPQTHTLLLTSFMLEKKKEEEKGKKKCVLCGICGY